MSRSTGRLTRRFWIALPFVVLLVALGLGLLFLQVASVLAKSDHESAQYAAAGEAYSVQRTITRWWPEPWKATFNEGTAILLQDDFFSARRTLEMALELAPPAPPAADGPDDALDPDSAECMVRTNLSLAIEGLANEAREAKARADAIALYNEALDVIAPCTSDGESESDEESDDQSDDSDDDGQSDDSDDQSDDDSDDSDGDSDSDSGDESDSDSDQDTSAQDQIEERQTQQRDQTRAEEEREQQGGQGGEGEQDDGDDQGQSGGQGTDPNEGGGGSEPDDPRVQELEDRNKEANEFGDDGGGGGFGGGQSW